MAEATEQASATPVKAPHKMKTLEQASATPVKAPQETHGLADGSQLALPDVETHDQQKLPKLKGYDVLQYLGGGSYGDVYKAKLRESLDGAGGGIPVDGIIAVKVQSKRRQSATPAKTTEQSRELSFLKYFKEHKHPCIMELLGWRETHFNLQLLMPFYEQDLGKYCRDGGILQEHATVLRGCMAAGLFHLHTHHIIHRDLKPGNVMVRCEPMAAIISDFGAAKKLLPMVPEGMGSEGLSVDCCTRWYAAPEVLLSSEKYSFPSDMWSFGITVAQMETGVAPFRKGYNISMLFDILQTLGTPRSTQWSDVCDAKIVHGVIGTFLFPMFRPRIEKPWGTKYGPAFVSYVDQLLQVIPKSRASAASIQHSRWHGVVAVSTMASQVCGASGYDLVPYIANKVVASQSELLESIMGMSMGVDVKAIALLCIMLLVVAMVCWCCGRCCGYRTGYKHGYSCAASHNETPDALLMISPGHKVHYYRSCHTLKNVTDVKSLNVCSYCKKNWRDNLAVKKGA